MIKKKKKQVPHECKCGIGNEGSSVQYDPKVWETVHCLTGVHISLVKQLQLFKIKINILFFNYVYYFFIWVLSYKYHI